MKLYFEGIKENLGLCEVYGSYNFAVLLLQRMKENLKRRKDFRGKTFSTEGEEVEKTASFCCLRVLRTRFTSLSSAILVLRGKSSRPQDLLIYIHSNVPN